MFAAPSDIETDIFASLPDKYHETGKLAEWLPTAMGRQSTPAAASQA